MEIKELALLYREYRNAIRKTLAHYENDWETVDDLYDEVFLRALESLDTFSGESELGTWLVAIASNVGKDHVRAKHADKRWHETLEVYFPEVYDDDDCEVPYYERGELSAYVAEESANMDPLAEVEAQDIYQTALRQMPRRVASVVELRAQGYTNTEVAELLHLSEKTVRNLVSESRQYFRDNS